jgi:hypothetical protein
VILSGPIPTSLELDAPLTISYAAEPGLGLNAIRGHAERENGELSLLLGSEVPIASLPLSVSRWTATDLRSSAEAIYRNLPTTRRYLSWAVGDHLLVANALSELEQLEDVLLQTALYEPALERDGGMLDLTALALARRAVETSLRTLQGSLLAWQLDFARMRGSQPRKNYSRALVEVGELPAARPCAYCGQTLSLTRHGNPLDPSVERFALTCARCWHVGDFASADFPQTLEVQEELRAGDPLALAIRFENTGRAPLYVDGCFLCEDFQPGGERSVATPPISAFVAPGESVELRASLATDPTLPHGRWVISAHMIVNGGINVLRRAITIV